MQCGICGVTFKRSSGSVIYTEGDGEIGICSSCHGDVFQDGIRYDTDFMIVPVSEDSFRTATQKRIYVCPHGHFSKRKPKFIAFYRGGGIGAITHVARVVKIMTRVLRLQIMDILKPQDFQSWMDKKRFKLFSLQKIVPLRHKIARMDSPPIQNRTYKTFKDFVKARKIKDLYARPQ